MIKRFKKQRLVFITLVYWFLLIYIVAALVWWFISLENQNRQMFIYRLAQIDKNDSSYNQKLTQIEDERKRKSTQYIGEGSTFLLLILVVAVFVYRATKRQIILSHQQQNFMMAVTHELKTPIAVVRLNLETLQRYKLDEAKQQKLINNTLQETERLKEENIEKDIFVTGETLLLQMLMNNLLDNALKYSDKETPVKVDIKKLNNKTVLKITDEGEGIADEEKKRIFQKFYRVGSETTRKAKGTGLGLYLCKRIVHDHKGTIAVQDNVPMGSIFIV